MGLRRRGVSQFLGVPYAAPVAGSARFAGPRALPPWTGSVEATTVAAPAPQSLPGFPLSSKWLGLAGVPPGDDCLRLNVTTPACDDARRPVMVFLHGGAFVFGTGGSPLYDGAALARRGDVVVVTINYRLGALGFGALHSLGYAAPSNRGLRDQVAALEWVAREIEAFGGDPRQVTLFGESAGAMSIGALMGVPAARPLFHRAILQSGAAYHVSSPARAARVTRAWLHALKAPEGDLEWLSSRPHADLQKAQRALGGIGFEAGRLPWQPVVDGDWFPEHPLEALGRGALADKEVLIGTNADEWNLFAFLDRRLRHLDADGLRGRLEKVASPSGRPGVESERALELYGELSSPDAWRAFQRDRVFVAPALALADAHAAAGGRTYVYRFDWQHPVAGDRWGSFHGLELPLVFGSLTRGPLLPALGVWPSARRRSRELGHAWSSFARSGTPALEGGGAWPLHRPGGLEVLALGEASSVTTRTDGERLRYQAELASTWRQAEESKAS